MAAFRGRPRQIGHLPENVVLYDNLNGLEILEFFACLRASAAPNARRCSTASALPTPGRRPVREYSRGCASALVLHQALRAPQVLFLDEPTNGPRSRGHPRLQCQLLACRRRASRSSSPRTSRAELQERVDRLAIMAAGKIQAVGSVQSLREQTQMPLVFELQLQAEDVPWPRPWRR